MWSCRAIAPIVEELAGQYQGKVKVGKMDVDRNGATPMRYKVTGIPTLLIFKNGQVVEQLVGYRSKEDIQKAIRLSTLADHQPQLLQFRTLRSLGESRAFLLSGRTRKFRVRT